MSKLSNLKNLIKFKKTTSFILAYCIALQFIVLSAPQTANAKIQQANQPITPIVECVQNSVNGNFTAWFGYDNPNANSVSIPVSAAQNKFTPAPFDRGQTTNFLSGRQKYAFSVDYPSNSKFIWHLNRKTATASSVFPTNCQQVDVEILSHTNNQVVNSASINLSGKAYNLLPNSNIANVFVNNSNATFNASTKNWTFNNFALNEGNNLINVRAVDNFGNEATTSITVIYQNITPRITSVEVNRGTQSQNLQVTIYGQNTHWIQGQTRASFGGEIAVGGSPEGELGLVNVINQTTATADLVINSKAALAPRNVRIVTNSEDINSPNAFTVLPVSPTGSATNNVSTIAGNAGQSGFADGVGNNSRFNDLSGIAVGNDDAVYVADAGNNRIRVVRQQVGGNWLTTTFAGDGTQGFQDGQGNNAKFNNPNGVAVANDGTVFVADSGNHSIRKILVDGTVSTFAGNGTSGFQDGQGNNATFNNPSGIAIDNAGNLYIADTGNSAVRKIDSSGNVTTLAGDGTVGSNDSPNARFNGLMGITVDGANVYVYIADGSNHLIRRLDNSGTVLTIAGSLRGFADGNANDSRFANPSGIAVDGGGRLIISDTVNSLIRVVSTNSEVSTLAGAGEYGSNDGVGNIAKFKLPKGIAVSRSSAIFVADSGNQTLRRIGLPPRILSFSPINGRIGDSVTIFGENFDGRSILNNTVTFAKVGGGTIQATVTSASRSQLSVVVPSEAATGKISVTTQDGTAESLTDFTVQQNPAPIITDFTPRRGQVGTSIKLIGTNLKVGNTNPNVTFAGSNNTRLTALVNSASATEVNVLVPNGAITGVIELTTGWGTAQTPQDFVVDETQQFQLVVSPSTVQAIERTRGTAVVSLTSSNSTFTQLAKLTAINLPNGVSATFEPNQITSGGTSTLHLNLANSTISSGIYQFTVRGTALIDGHEVSEDTNVSLSVLTAGQTTLSGRVLNTDSEPIIGATVSLDGQTATTDSSGSFLLSGVTAGNLRPLQIDGRTANSPNRTYPVITEPANIVAGEANQIPYIFYLPPIDVQYEVDVIPTQETIVENPRVEGLKMTIPPNSNLRNRDGSPVTRVSITPLAIDRTPTPLPSNVSMGLVYTSQPGGALSDKPIPVIYPNLLGTEPGTVVELWAFNHDTVQWYVYGYGTVSQDGKVITPNINPNTNEPYGLTDFSWHAPSAPPPFGNPGDGKDSCPSGKTNRPVDLTTGIKIETVTDIAFGGSRGGLALTRTYTSDLINQTSGRFSRGWKDGYDIKIIGNAVVGGALRIILPEELNGRLYSYSNTENGNLIFKRLNSAKALADYISVNNSGGFTYRYGNGELMNFDNNGRLLEIIDKNENKTVLTYSDGKLTQITDAVGRSLSYFYDSNDRVIKVTDPLNREWNYTYTNNSNTGRLSSVTDPLGNKTQYIYSNFWLEKIVDARGNTVKTITHDANGRVIKQEFADGGFETYEYQTSGAIVTQTKVTDTLGRIMIKRFNANGYVIEQTDGAGQRAIIDRNLNNSLSLSTKGSCGCIEESRKYDNRGNVTETTDKTGNISKSVYETNYNNVTKTIDKLGRETNFAYDAKGNLTSVTDVLGRTSGASYDNFGRLIGTTDALMQTESFEYDANGYMTARIDKLGKRWTMQYDLIGRLISQSDPLNRTTSYTYDNLDRVKTITDSAGAITTFDYDENSNRTKVIDHLGRVWRSFYDSKNRLIRTVDPIGRASKRTYNVGDEITKVTSPSNREMRYEYDFRGQAVKIFDAFGNASEFTYDYEKKLKTIKDKRGNVTSFEYDELDRPILQRNPLGQTSSAKYDSLGKVTETTDELGRRTNYTYDTVNRLTNITYADAQVGYTYDTLNRITQISDTQGGTLNWTYDQFGQVLSETTANGIVSYTYNDSRQRTSMTALNRPSVNYGYDSAGRLGSISQGSETFGYNYDSISRLTSLTRPNGVNTSYEYDEVNRLKRMTHGTIEDFKYEYNSDDEISSITSLNSATVSPTEKTSSGANQANRIAQFGDSTFNFDDKGQTITQTNASGTTTYKWDVRGRLKNVALPNGQSVSYNYDALGRRSSRTSNNQTTNFVYDGQDVVADVGSSTADYLNGLGIDDKLKVDNKYFIKDHLGSTIGLTATNGNLVESQKYEAFGKASNSLSTRYGYTGREYDADTKLNYYRARWYDAEQGRFISSDLIGFQAGENFYSYVDNSPLNLTDSSGLQPSPKYKERCEAWKKLIENISKDILKRTGEMAEDKQGLPWRAPNDKANPATSRWGHKNIIDQLKAKRAEYEAYRKAFCGDDDDDENNQSPVPVPVPIIVPNPNPNPNNNAEYCPINNRPRLPLLQPTQMELDLNAEAAEYNYRAWASVTVGLIAIATVITGGAAAGAVGAGEASGGTALIPALAAL